MPFFKRKENIEVDEKSLAVRTGNASGYQKTENYRKGQTGERYKETLFVQIWRQT